jgi:hypothetical protein
MQLHATEQLREMVEVEPHTWVCVWLTFVVVWACTHILSPAALSLCFLAFGYFVAFSFKLMSVKLRRIKTLLMPALPPFDGRPMTKAVLASIGANIDVGVGVGGGGDGGAGGGNGDVSISVHTESSPLLSGGSGGNGKKYSSSDKDKVRNVRSLSMKSAKSEASSFASIGSGSGSGDRDRDGADVNVHHTYLQYRQAAYRKRSALGARFFGDPGRFL